MTKIPVYLMPGLAASSQIFEKIKLDESQFELFYLEWEIPLQNETLSNYALRMTEKIQHENPVLIGVSFGGILVQEMAAYIKVQKLIIISSVKTNLEFSTTFKLAKATKAYKLMPTTLFANVESLSKFSFGDTINKRIKLYEKFLKVRDKNYLDWAVEQVILWERTVAVPNVIQIHGDLDEVFPIKNIEDCMVIRGGTHIMILNKYKWLNENLPRIILQ